MPAVCVRLCVGIRAFVLLIKKDAYQVHPKNS